MSPEENKALVRQAIDAFNRRDIEGFLALFAPGCIFHEPPAAAPGTLAEVRQSAINALSSVAFPDLQISLEDLIAEGKKIVVRYTYHGTYAPTGQAVAYTAISLLHMADGKAQEDWAQVDALGLLRQIDPDSVPY